MAKSVKTLFMDAVKADLETISAIKKVKRGAAIPIDRDTAVFPFAAFSTDMVGKKPRNRVQELEFDLVIGVTLLETGGKIVEELADDLDAAIETKMLKTGTVLEYASKIIPVSSDVLYPDDLETGLLVAIYRITLLHEYGDATNPGR